MGERAHLSIGEVLALVQEEFTDITISKIRFLESQGLLDPERTPSGYRKFYPSDIERLQWILMQQRDHFLPLKVIRERLAEWDATGTPPSGSQQAPSPEDLPGSDQRVARPDRPEPTSGGDTTAPDHEEAPVPDEPDRDEEVAEDEEVAQSRRAASSLAAGSAMEVSSPSRTGPDDTVDATAAPAPLPDGPPDEAPSLHVGPHDSALTAEELAERAGVDVGIVHDLEGYSMIESRRVGPESYYDPEYLSIVRACRAFLDHGVEVRHLRMYKIAAEREAGVFEQLIMPLLKQRNPDARARAVGTVRELAEAGEELHAELLRHALQHTLP